MINNFIQSNILSIGPRAKQFVLLYGSMLLTLILGIITSSFNAKYLGAIGFGEFKLAQTIIIFLSTFIQFGFFVSVSRLIAQKKYERIEYHITGGSLFIAIVQGFAIISILLVCSGFINKLFNADINTVFLFTLPLLFAFPIKSSLENIFQGNNSIGNLSLLRILPPTLYILFSYYFTCYHKFEVKSAFAIFCATMFVTCIYFTLRTKPKFSKLSKSIKIIFGETRRYGLNVHIGVIAAVTTGQLSVLILGYISGAEMVGKFALAQAITSPLLMVPGCVATSYFKDFANSNRIARKIITNTLGVSILSLLGFLLIVDRFVHSFFPSTFIDVVTISYIMAIGSILHGFGDLLNRFIGAHGQGQLLKYGAILAGVVNMLGCAILVPAFGLFGAGINVLIEGFVYITAMYVFYQRLSSRLVSSAQVQ